jgi:hypothetical protein
MLLNAKAFNEGARALALWGALQVDLSRKAQSEDERQTADDLIGLLTPVIKGFFTDKGYENATNAQQCLGGHGYIREWGLEQFVRDARIAMIYEGTNGIQALDLVGRKLALNGGRALRAYMRGVGAYIGEQKESDEMREFIEPLESALGDLQKSTTWLMQNALTDPENAGAASVPYLYVMGLVAIGHMWAQIARTSIDALGSDCDDREFYENKLLTARYYCSNMLPETTIHRIRVEAGSKNLMELDAQAF